MVERQPSKLNVAGSNPVSRSKNSCEGRNLIIIRNEEVNTLRRCSSGVERFLGKEEVPSSTLGIGSN